MRRAVHQILPIKSTRMLSATLASRLKSGVKEFYVILDDPHKIYRPGDEVSGQVVLIASKNLTDLLIKLSLVGLIKINSHGPLRSQKKQYLFNHSITLYGDVANNEMALTKGEHRFPFIVKLPKKNIYTSISFEKGEIKYTLTCDLCDKTFDGAKILNTEKLINIVKPINLSILPEALEMARLKSRCLFHQWDTFEEKPFR
ncbi:unnamed protein product [Ambrosiozyma monospora]|uniref:Unnamed protein product n=1 Tax=Ambrosiozyma monospora TaxID=43982 RepID=A0ACB5U186_AMBMO|nr:unnamed protein product [Ambrosiozyma monospora]